mmetsp:Transcript_15258/g.63379  ORF Transcript_15258/g.63379 Transcript_15258/m.63379 type:complete len:285 (-) Transcript_15258:1220-2074(-)
MVATTAWSSSCATPSGLATSMRARPSRTLRSAAPMTRLLHCSPTFTACNMETVGDKWRLNYAQARASRTCVLSRGSADSLAVCRQHRLSRLRSLCPRRVLVAAPLSLGIRSFFGRVSGHRWLRRCAGRREGTLFAVGAFAIPDRLILVRSPLGVHLALLGPFQIEHPRQTHYAKQEHGHDMEHKGDRSKLLLLTSSPRKQWSARARGALRGDALHVGTPPSTGVAKGEVMDTDAFDGAILQAFDVNCERAALPKPILERDAAQARHFRRDVRGVARWIGVAVEI